MKLEEPYSAGYVRIIHTYTYMSAVHRHTHEHKEKRNWQIEEIEDRRETNIHCSLMTDYNSMLS